MVKKAETSFSTDTTNEVTIVVTGKSNTEILKLFLISCPVC